MALSNIFREAQREITESVLGIVVVAAVLVPFVWGDFLIARWLDGPDMPFEFALAVGLFMEIVGVLLIILGVLVTHWVGEDICDALERRGVHLRPRERN